MAEVFTHAFQKLLLKNQKRMLKKVVKEIVDAENKPYKGQNT